MEQGPVAPAKGAWKWRGLSPSLCPKVTPMSCSNPANSFQIVCRQMLIFCPQIRASVCTLQTRSFSFTKRNYSPQQNVHGFPGTLLLILICTKEAGCSSSYVMRVLFNHLSWHTWCIPNAAVSVHLCSAAFDNVPLHITILQATNTSLA